MIAAGAGCGVLETRHLEGRGLKLPYNLAAGAVGGVAAGWFFSVWGQLAHGWLGPMASGAIGAAFLLPPMNWLATLSTGKTTLPRKPSPS